MDFRDAPPFDCETQDATFEIYEPPYLFRGRRPAVRKVRPVMNGRKLRVILKRRTAAADINEVVLVRLGSNTHSMDADMRAVTLRHRSAGARCA